MITTINSTGNMASEIAQDRRVPVERITTTPIRSLDDGRTALFVRQYVRMPPQATADYFDAITDEMDAYIHAMPGEMQAMIADSIQYSINSWNGSTPRCRIP